MTEASPAAPLLTEQDPAAREVSLLDELASLLDRRGPENETKVGPGDFGSLFPRDVT